ncbi:MAG: hypothetical protein ACYCPN_04510 [Thermoplasmata archaeon]
MHATDRRLRTRSLWRTHGRTLAATLLGTALMLPGAGPGPGPSAPSPAASSLPAPLRPGPDRPAAERTPGGNRGAPQASEGSSGPMDPPVAFGLCGGFLAGLLALAMLPGRSPGPGSIPGEVAPALGASGAEERR